MERIEHSMLSETSLTLKLDQLPKYHSTHLSDETSQDVVSFNLAE